MIFQNQAEKDRYDKNQAINAGMLGAAGGGGQGWPTSPGGVIPVPAGVKPNDAMQELMKRSYPTQKPVLGTQIGGDHYTRQKIQPITYIWANGLGFSEGNVVKYVTRWPFKGGIKDLEKAKHHIALLIEEAQRAEREDGVKYGMAT